MSTRDESIARHVEQLKKASGFFSILAWLVWAEFALALGLGMTLFSDFVQHWGVFVVLFFIYALVSAGLLVASRTLRVIVFTFDELRLVV